MPFSQKRLTIRPTSPTTTSSPPSPRTSPAAQLQQLSFDAAASADAALDADVELEGPQDIPAAYLMPEWEGAAPAVVAQLRQQRRLGWGVSPPVAPGALTAPTWPHPPLQRPRPPLRRSAGLGELSGDGGAEHCICFAQSGCAVTKAPGTACKSLHLTDDGADHLNANLLLGFCRCSL